MTAHIAKAALAVVLPQFRLDPASNIHGRPHWARVWRNGRKIAEASPGVDIDLAVVCWFAFLHDACRRNDDRDPQHGARAVDLACSMRDRHIIDLSWPKWQDLARALNSHSDGLTKGSPTVLTCWDADRLDLGRVGIRPDPNRMCTPAGSHMAEALSRYHKE